MKSFVYFFAVLGIVGTGCLLFWYAYTDPAITFTETQCALEPTGRANKMITIIRDANGEPAKLDTKVVSYEYVTVCARSDWR